MSSDVNPINPNQNNNILHTFSSNHQPKEDLAIQKAFSYLKNTPSIDKSKTQEAINTISQALKHNPKNDYLVSEAIRFLSTQLQFQSLQPADLLEIFIFLNKNSSHFSNENQHFFNQFLNQTQQTQNAFSKVIRTVWINPDLLLDDHPHSEVLTSDPKTLKLNISAPKTLKLAQNQTKPALNLQYNQASNANKAIYTDANIRLQIAEELRDVKMDITFTRMLAQYFGGKRIGFIMAIISLGYLPPMLYISPLVYDLLVKMATLKEKRNLFKCAFVAESVVSIGQIEKAPNIELIPSKLVENENTYTTRFQDLIDQNFLRILSLHTHPFLSKAHKFASNAAIGFTQKIDIQILKTNSLGLGLLVSKLNKLIKEHYSPEDLLDFIRQCKKSTRYFAIPNQFNYQKAAHWLETSLTPREKFNLKLLNYIPVFELKETFQVIALFKSKEEAFQFLQQQLSEHKKHIKHIHTIGVEYRQCYRDALHLQNALRRNFRRVHQNTHVSDSITTEYMGDNFVGICII